jgi:hypothetical protein
MKMKYVIFILACFVAAGCNKIRDHYLGIIHGKPAACKLTQINYPKTDDNIYKTDIHYNTWGFPDAITYTTSMIESSEPFVYTFIYDYDDKKRILSQTSDYYYGQRTHYYGYVGSSQLPFTDTVPGFAGEYEVMDLERDAFGRVIKITSRMGVYDPENGIELLPTQVFKYYYDSNGNRQEDPSNPGYPGIIHYSSKPSLYSLHPVWEIIYHNSSRNSPDFAEAYNNNGYPTKIRTGDINWTPFLTVGEGAIMVYECKK